MGGNLFKKPRIPKQQYLHIIEELTPFLQKQFGSLYRIPRSYGNKPDYGDLDILVSNAALQNPKWQSEIVQALGLEEYKSHSGVFSTVYCDFQVDYITVPADELDSTYNFMSFNVLGNLLGKIYHKFGAKYGENGLTYPLRNLHGSMTEEVELSKDMGRILGFLELDAAVWEQGFDQLEDVFKYVIGCKYFTSQSYSDENATNRSRKKYRKDYETFMEYLRHHRITKEYPFSKEKSIYVKTLDAYFPEAQLPERIQVHEERQEIARQVQEKFNGRIVMELMPGLKDKELGTFIIAFKNRFPDFERYVLQTDAEQIRADILAFNTQR